MRPSRALRYFYALVWLTCLNPVRARGQDYARSVQCNLAGTLVDFTINSGCDRRIYSARLGQWRDLYVYLPPNYDPQGSYPLLIWLHGYATDERWSVKNVFPVVDQAIVQGQLPPLVVAIPDGSLSGNARFVPSGSWYVNSRRGRFADYITDDVLGFLQEKFAIRHDRGGRAIAGFSMGGFGAYGLGIRNPEKFGVVAGISPALSMRYVGCGGRYMDNFNPDCWFMRQNYKGQEIIGKFYWGLINVRAWHVARSVWGRGPRAVQELSRDNPIELLLRFNVANNQQTFYVAYGKHDQLNVDAQVESFLYVAQQQGVNIETRVYPCGTHDIPFMVRSIRDMFAWLNRSLTQDTAGDIAGAREQNQE